MKKFILDLTVTENIRLNANYVLLKLTSQSLLPEMLPGQFAEIRVDGSPTTFLRRPISINFVDKQRQDVWQRLILVIQLMWCFRWEMHTQCLKRLLISSY